jgi:hypothetical protein
VGKGAFRSAPGGVGVCEFPCDEIGCQFVCAHRQHNNERTRQAKCPVRQRLTRQLVAGLRWASRSRDMGARWQGHRLGKTTFETSQTETHGIGSAGPLRLKSFVSEEAVAILRHSSHATYISFRNECTEANFGARIRYSDNLSGPLPTSTVVLPNCVHRPVHQVGISMPRDATGRPLRYRGRRRERNS